jgi:CAAX protease family protein
VPPRLIAEAIGLFVVAPAVLSLVMRPGLLFPAIWLLGAICLAALVRDGSFERRLLWNRAGVRGVLRSILVVFVVCAALLAGALLVAEPERLLQLPRQRPGLWAAIMVLYPVLSVYPQEVAFRAFFCHRYSRLFGSGFGLVIASALAFGFAHIIMRNWWAVGFSTVGGVLFASTFLKSRSLAAAGLEHTLYGCFLFTIGWGQHFYSGAMR